MELRHIVISLKNNLSKSHKLKTTNVKRYWGQRDPSAWRFL